MKKHTPQSILAMLHSHSHDAPRGCRVLTQHLESGGYGRVGYQGRVVYAHRLVYELAHGPIPAGKNILHKCDNPPCIALDHLWIGTQLDNIRDRDQKGRGSDGSKNLRGQQHGGSKLTEYDVLLIRSSTLSGKAMAKQCCVSQATVSMIRNRRIWKHL